MAFIANVSMWKFTMTRREYEEVHPPDLRPQDNGKNVDVPFQVPGDTTKVQYVRTRNGVWLYTYIFIAS